LFKIFLEDPFQCRRCRKTVSCLPRFAQPYRKYSTDLLKPVFYGRKLLANAKVETCLQVHHPEILTRFRQVIGEAG
jgi:hypothetical protein